MCGIFNVCYIQCVQDSMCAMFNVWYIRRVINSMWYIQCVTYSILIQCVMYSKCAMSRFNVWHTQYWFNAWYKLQVSFRRRAAIHRALLRKMTCKDKASCKSKVCNVLIRCVLYSICDIFKVYIRGARCSVLQCVAVCCSVLQCVAVCFDIFKVCYIGGARCFDSKHPCVIYSGFNLWHPSAYPCDVSHIHIYMSIS